MDRRAPARIRLRPEAERLAARAVGGQLDRRVALDVAHARSGPQAAQGDGDAAPGQAHGDEPELAVEHRDLRRRAAPSPGAGRRRRAAARRRTAAAAPRRSRHAGFPQRGRERARGAPAVRDVVLLVGRELGDGARVAARHEERVVAEAALAARAPRRARPRRGPRRRSRARRAAPRRARRRTRPSGRRRRRGARAARRCGRRRPGRPSAPSAARARRRAPRPRCPESSPSPMRPSAAASAARALSSALPA